MSELECTLLANWKSHQAAAEGYVKQIEELQFQLEKVSYERDKLLVDNAALAQGKGINTNGRQDRKGKLLKEEKAQDPTARPAEVKMLDQLREKETDDYKSRLLHPTDRRRGKAAGDLIQSVLDGAIPPGR